MADLIGIDGRISQRVPIACDDDEEAKRRIGLPPGGPAQAAASGLP